MAYTPQAGWSPSGSTVQNYLWQLMNQPTDQGNIGSEWLGAGYQQPQSPEELYSYLQSINFGADKPWGGQTNWLQGSTPGDLNDPMSPSYTKDDSGSLVGDWLKDFGPVLAAPLATGALAGGGLWGGAQAGAGGAMDMGVGLSEMYGPGSTFGSGIGASAAVDAPWGVNPAADYGSFGQGEFAGMPGAEVGSGGGGLPTGTGLGGAYATEGGAMDMFGSMNPSGAGSAFTGSGLWGAGAASGGGGLLNFLGKVSPSTWLNVGASLLGSGINYLGATSAAKTQAKAAADQQGLLKYMYDQNRADLAPWRQAGVGALGNLTNLTTPGKQLDTAMLDPGYAFRQSEGEKGINRAAAARGLWDSGPTYKALDRFNQNYATGEFSNVYNRNANLAGLGQVAVGQGVNAGQNYAQNAGESMLQAANARGSGYVGGANALSGGLSALINQYNQQEMLDKILRGRG